MPENKTTIEQSTEALPVLTSEQLQRETGYRLGLSISRKMHEQGLLTTPEFRRFEQLLAKKFSPIWGAFL